MKKKNISSGNNIWNKEGFNRYIGKKGALTDKYYEEKANGTLQVAEEVADCAASVVEIIGSIYDPKAMQPENARSNNGELQVDEEPDEPEGWDEEKLWPQWM